MSEQIITPGGKYEFTERHNWVFEYLVRNMRIVAAFMMVLGALSAVGGVLALLGFGGAQGGARWFAGASGLIGGALWITMSGFLYTSSHFFRLITETTGRDVKHLMAAVEQLGKAFVVMAIGFSLQLILFGVGMVVASQR